MPREVGVTCVAGRANESVTDPLVGRRSVLHQAVIIAGGDSRRLGGLHVPVMFVMVFMSVRRCLLGRRVGGEAKRDM
jgi:hypothetical protein